jgi:hypothetical protein
VRNSEHGSAPSTNTGWEVINFSRKAEQHIEEFSGEEFPAAAT